MVKLGAWLFIAVVAGQVYMLSQEPGDILMALYVFIFSCCLFIVGNTARLARRRVMMGDTL